MKTFVVCGLHFVVLGLIFLAGPVFGESLGYVATGPDGYGGVRAEAAVDLAALSRNEAVQNAPWYAKPFAAIREVGMQTKTAVVENPGKTALAVVSGVVVYRGLRGKLDDDWRRLRGKSTSGKKSAQGDVIGDESNTTIVINNEINGNGNTINQDIVIQAPKGDGTGMKGNAGQREEAVAGL